MMEQRKGRSKDMNSIALTGKADQLLARIQCFDQETSQHSIKVQTYSLFIGRQLGLADSELEVLGIASLLHDIGKIYIPRSIILKPEKLNKREATFMKRHPSYGYRYLKYHEIPEEIAVCVLQHHEHIDGSGYPYQLKGEQIHKVTQILQVADVYDALSSNRPYRRAFSKDEIIKEFETGKYFENAVEVILNSITSGKFCGFIPE